MWVEFMSIFGDQRHFPLYNLNRSLSIARLTLGNSQLSFPCAIGRNGQTTLKREGDGKTPIGCWSPLMVFYRRDKISRPITSLPIEPVRKNDGWCDQPFDRNYNRGVKHPYPASAEQLWRHDNQYDIIIVLNHNQCPRIQNAGSAIFMHIAKPAYTPTEGCIALKETHLRQLLSYMKPSSKLIV